MYPYETHWSDVETIGFLIGCGISIWLIVLFVLLCERVVVIKDALIVGLDLEERDTNIAGVFRRVRRKGTEEPTIGTGASAVQGADVCPKCEQPTIEIYERSREGQKWICRNCNHTWQS